MNDGILAIIIQWCLLCVIWMGVLDRPLRRLGLHRTSGLALVTVSLVCAFVHWQVYFFPVEINISGFLFPLLLAAWSWQFVSFRQKIFILLAASLTTVLLFFVRKLLFKDPVLLIFDELAMYPVLTVVIFHFLSRNLVCHWFLLLVAVPLSDALFSLSFLEQTKRSVIGGEYQQDLFWLTVMVWGVVSTVWLAAANVFHLLGKRIVSVLPIKPKSTSDR